MSEKTITPLHLSFNDRNRRISDLEGRIRDLGCQLEVAQNAADEWRAKAYAARDDVAHWRDLYGRPR
jgi:hypothetical protein